MKKGLPQLRFHSESCFLCRYYRVHKTGATTSDCLLLGRMLSISGNPWDDRARLCDGFKKRPKTWNIYSSGPDNSPYWHDPYISRETQHKLRARFGNKEPSKKKGEE